MRGGKSPTVAGPSPACFGGVLRLPPLGGDHMRTPVSIAAVAVVTAAGLLYSASTAWAAVPTNDTIAGATPISALPFTATLDTTQATTDADDASINANCGAPATEASVWYSYTASADGAVVIDVSQS